MGLIALFGRIFRRHYAVLDHLSANSYGIYLLHYLVVIWLQYAVLRADMPAGAKFGIVFLGGLAVCWGLSAVLRKVRAVRKII